MIAHVGRLRMKELVWRSSDEPLPLVLREREPHHGLVSREGQVHDPADPKLDPSPDTDLVAARKPFGQASHVVDRHHCSILAQPHAGETGRATMTRLSPEARAARFADEYVRAHGEFAELIGSLTEEQWQLPGKNFPQRINDEDEHRSIGVIAHHVADSEQFIIDRIYLMLEGKPLPPADIRTANARHAVAHSGVTRADVLARLRANEAAIAPRVRAIPDAALDVVHETPAGPATIAQRLERVLVGHLRMHEGSIKAALS